VQRIGVNRIRVSFKSFRDANEVVGYLVLTKNFIAILSFRVIQTSIVNLSL